MIDRNVYSLSNYNPAYARRGYLEVLDSATGLRGILSLLTDRLIVPATYSKFSYYSSASNGTYIRAYSSETSYDLYDYRGFLLKKNLDPNKKLTIKATTETLRYERKHLIEVITYDGVSEANEVYKDGSRKSFVAPCDLLWVDDTGFIPGTSELSDLAMEGCIGTIEHGRNKVTYESGERAKMEMKYFEKMGLFHDFVIILKTIPALFRKDEAM